MYFSLSFFLLSSCQLSQAQNCKIESKVYSNAPVKESVIVPQLEKHKLDFFYENGQVDEVRKKINLCNQQNASELLKIEKERRNKIDKINNLLRYADIAKIREQVRELKRSQEQAGINLEKSLDGNYPSGLFLVLIKNVNDPKTENLQSASLSAIAQMAVKDIRGSHVKRVTGVTNLKEVEDIVQSYTSGIMQPVGSALREIRSLQGKYYLYLARVEVKLLKKTTPSLPAISLPSTTPFNLEIDVDYETKLLSAGVIREHIDEIKGLVEAELDKINQSNSELLNILRIEVQKTENEIKSYSKRIEQLIKDEKESKGEIEKLCIELNVPFNPNAPEQSAGEARKKLKFEVANLEAQIIDIKDREIYPLRQALKGSSDGDLYTDIAKKIVEGTVNLETQAGKSFEIEEMIEVKNGILVQDIKSNTVRFNRKITQIWAYPIAGANNDFQVVLFGQFKSIKGEPSREEIDKDNDGIPDFKDKCPNDAGLKELNGCPDKDKDGVADIDDKCPNVSGSPKWSGCTPPDTDGDGINDDLDRCIKEKGKPNLGGCPDSDNDGIANPDDECPYDKGPFNNKGCPKLSFIERAFPDKDDANGFFLGYCGSYFKPNIAPWGIRGGYQFESGEFFDEESLSDFHIFSSIRSDIGLAENYSVMSFGIGTPIPIPIYDEWIPIPFSIGYGFDLNNHKYTPMNEDNNPQNKTFEMSLSIGAPWFQVNLGLCLRHRKLFKDDKVRTGMIFGLSYVW